MNIRTKKKNDTKPKNCEYNYTGRGTRTVKFNTGIVKFSNLYVVRNPYAKYGVAFALGFIMSIFSVLLVEVTGLYTGGITAMFQGLARFVYAILEKYNPDGSSIETQGGLNFTLYNFMYWGFYMMVNIPLLIFAYKKINKQFALLSLTYLLTLQGMGFIWGFVDGFHEIKLFGDTLTVDQYLNHFNIQVIVFKPYWCPSGIPTPGVTWDKHGWSNLISWGDAEYDVQADVVTENITRAFLLLLYAFVFAVLTGTTYSVLYILGGSSAGSDIISIYFSQEKNKNLGFVVFLIHSICMTIGIFLGSYLSGIILKPEYARFEYFLSANFVASFTWVLLHSLMLNKIFPWKKLIKVEIYTSKLEEIRCHLRKVNYIHPTTIVDGTGGYSQQSTKILMTICMVIELPNLISAIRTIDDKCLISSSSIVDLDGTMVVQKQTG